MSSGLIVAVVVIALVVVALGAAAVLRRQQQHPNLRRRFGAEYERTVARHGGDTAAAEQDLAQRVARHRELTLTPLGATARAQAEQQWREVQAHFVDAPGQALAEADALLARVARDRGYPDTDADARIEAISVDHGDHVEAYRALRALPGPDTTGPTPNTEEQRVTLLRARELFVALVNADRSPERVPDEASAKPRVPASRRASHVPAQREHHA
ncbi:hypothetical protein [Streptomyces sp. TLI_171]|uniref:hypothetical protein n=1 Tax=Streptomyces sp. TLI_171 TaxID=1938859 RepID=UPI000C174147|nr:hypothetical protein [Streptomyces sp. TLI_171]RKE17319.1 hypothetical protein BX266_0575 [Streptomyces sp. TLI_171]